MANCIKIATLAALVFSANVPAHADVANVSLLTELERLETIDFEVTGVLKYSDYPANEYHLYVSELGSFPVIIEAGRDTRQMIEDNCQVERGCEVSVIGRLDLELPIVMFSIGDVTRISTHNSPADLRKELAACWNIGALSGKDLQNSLTIAFEVTDGTLDVGSIRYVSGSKPKPELLQFFESVRRAVMRCSLRGGFLPDGTSEVTFDPRQMR